MDDLKLFFIKNFIHSNVLILIASRFKDDHKLYYHETSKIDVIYLTAGKFMQRWPPRLLMLMIWPSSMPRARISSTLFCVHKQAAGKEHLLMNFIRTNLWVVLLRYIYGLIVSLYHSFLIYLNNVFVLIKLYFNAMINRGLLGFMGPKCLCLSDFHRSQRGGGGFEVKVDLDLFRTKVDPSQYFYLAHWHPWFASSSPWIRSSSSRKWTGRRCWCTHPRVQGPSRDW